MSFVCRKMDRAGGFTLIELLVVVFLIGLISGFAVLSVNTIGDDRQIEDQLRLLQYQLAMAGEVSVVQGSPVGVQFNKGQYFFLIAGKSKWLALDDGKVFQPRKLLQSWEFELRIRGESFPLFEVEDDDSETELSPQVVFYSSGEVDPFEILIVDENHAHKFKIVYGDDGAIELESMNEG